MELQYGQLCVTSVAVEGHRAVFPGTTAIVTLPPRSLVKVIMPKNKDDATVLISVEQCSEAPNLVGNILELVSAAGLQPQKG